MSLDRTHTGPERATSAQGLDPAALARWLATPALRTPDGQVLSWLNDAHPGYPYPEATALWLSWAAWRRERGLPGPRGQAMGSAAGWLAAQLRGDGAIGRDGRRYAFDTALALHALARAARIPGLVELRPREVAPLSAGLDAFLEADSPVLPETGTRPRWSDRWEGHLVRAASLLALAGIWLEHPPTVRRAEALRARARLLGVQEPCYVHALAYQAEGQLLLDRLGYRDEGAEARAAAGRMAALQRADGLMPAWSDRPKSARCDATAQAIRLWLAIDPTGFDEPIERAAAALGRLQDPDGGLPYAPGRDDLNTWVALFTDQALHWRRQGAEPEALL